MVITLGHSTVHVLYVTIMGEEGGTKVVHIKKKPWPQFVSSVCHLHGDMTI